MPLNLLAPLVLARISCLIPVVTAQSIESQMSLALVLVFLMTALLLPIKQMLSLKLLIRTLRLVLVLRALPFVLFSRSLPLVLLHISLLFVFVISALPLLLLPSSPVFVALTIELVLLFRTRPLKPMQSLSLQPESLAARLSIQGLL